MVSGLRFLYLLFVVPGIAKRFSEQAVTVPDSTIDSTAFISTRRKLSWPTGINHITLRIKK